MKKIILYLLFILPGCNQTTHKTPTSSFVTLGSLNTPQTWIYLCGLTNHFNPQMNEFKVLDTLGKELNIKILAIKPHHKCPQLHNLLCWPQDNKDEVLNTYQEIINIVHPQKINGYIGFSNGGFFLIQLSEYISLNKPIIAIGAGGRIKNTQGPHNTIHVLIGKQDQWHYEHAINLYKQSKNTNLTIDLIEYDGGHEIPANTLKNVLQNLL
jgi:hypothetical protein